MRRFSAAIVLVVALAAIAWTGALAQEITTGILEVTVTGSEGGPVANGTVTITGPQGARTESTDKEGRADFRNLTPGSYTVKVEASGFTTIRMSGVGVILNRRTQLPVVLSPGKVEEVEVTVEAPLVDLKSTTVGADISMKNLVQYIPVGRNFAAIFTLSPGVVSGLGSGPGNFSISGSSGLENSYIVDGVNITNSGYGGIGSYNRRYGSLGTGVTGEWIDSVEVKEGGFEPEFGQATGGVINAIVKNGTNDFSGQVSLFASPKSFQSNRRLPQLHPDNAPIRDQGSYDFGASLGGPIMKDRLFWFAAYNPSQSKADFVRLVQDDGALFFHACAGDTTVACGIDQDCVDAGVAGPCSKIAFDPSQTTGGRAAERTRTSDNYAGKVSWYASPNHRVEVTAFGDPSTAKSGPQLGTALRRAGDQGFSKLDYGGNSYSLKYFGAVTSGFFVEALVGRHDSKLKEIALPIYEVFDTDVPGGLPTGGLGFTPDTEEKVDQYALKFTYVIGDHEIRTGYQQDNVDYSESAKNTGPPWTAHFPIAQFVCSGNHSTVCTSDTDCTAVGGTCSEPRWSGSYLDFQSTTGAFIEKSGGVFTVSRSRFGPLKVLTKNTEKNFFLYDIWSITPRVTVKFGARWTQEFVTGGAPFSLPFRVVRASSSDRTATRASRTRMVDPTQSTAFNPTALTFPEEWAPRVGVTWDLRGNGKYKLYANYAKYVQRLTQDLAYRSFSNEVDLSQNFANATLTTPLAIDNCPTPATTLRCSNNTTITCTSDLDCAGPPPGQCNVIRTVNAPCQGIVAAAGLGGPTVAWPGTKLPYTKEYLVGFTQELVRDMSLDLRYIHRGIGRNIEDFSYVPEESIHNTIWGTGAGFPFDPFPQYPVEFFGDYVLANIGENTPEAIAGQAPAAIAALYASGLVPQFPKAERNYDAIEAVLNKRFSNNWLTWIAYRHARLRGNYEGLLRNDNGQDDPNITSLFDFPNTPLLRGQFLIGPLNTEVVHNLKAFGSYQLKSGVQIGGAFNFSTGVPRFPQLVHPNDFYQLPGNGEVPGTDPVYGTWYTRCDVADIDPSTGACTNALAPVFLALSHGVQAPPTEMTNGATDSNGNLVFTPYQSPPPDQKDLVTPSAVSGANQFLYSYTPITRDFIGHRPALVTIDGHASYNFKTGMKGSSLRVVLDVFNIFNTQEASEFDDVTELQQAQANPNFLRPTLYQGSRAFRLGLSWSF